jgi:hypothetical protein
MGASTLYSYICRTQGSRILDKTLLEPFFKSNGINARTLKKGKLSSIWPDFEPFSARKEGQFTSFSKPFFPGERGNLQPVTLVSP